MVRMQDNSRFSRELMRLPNIPVSNANVMEAVKLFIDMMGPTSEPCLNELKDWMTVEHTSEPLVSVETESTPKISAKPLKRENAERQPENSTDFFAASGDDLEQLNFSKLRH